MVDFTKYIEKINSGLLTDAVIGDVLKEVYWIGYNQSKMQEKKDVKVSE